MNPGKQPSTATQAARLLLAVRRGAPRLAALPAALAPQTLAEAYAIQHALLDELGSDIAGWKASLSSVDEGICAPLAASTVLDAPAYAAMLRPRVIGFAPCATEAEVAFRLGHDLPPLAAGARYDRETVCAAVASAHAVIEVISSRYLDEATVPQFGRVADSYMNLLLVVGPSCPDWRKLQVETLPLEVRVDGIPGAPGSRRPSARRSAAGAGVARQSPLAAGPRPARRRDRHHRQLQRRTERAARADRQCLLFRSRHFGRTAIEAVPAATAARRCLPAAAVSSGGASRPSLPGKP